MKSFFSAVIGIFMASSMLSQANRSIFEFEFEGVTLNGVLDIPSSLTSKGLVLIVHGSGETNAVAQNWHAEIRAMFVEAGYSTYMWDKPGCGSSGGTFDYNQPISNSADEVIKAIQALKEKRVLGSDSIGLWGISRAGWINPVVINRYPDIRFWISVSGVDDKENFKYLLEENLRIDGLPKDSIALIVDEYLAGVKIGHSGGGYADYQEATSNLQKNAFWLRFTNGGVTKEGYYSYQPTFMKDSLDTETGLMVYVKDFSSTLKNIKCPVLAIFGEKDMNVDWKLTKSLYESTLGENTELTIRSFPGCNHNLVYAPTGGFYEMQDKQLPWAYCDGYLESISAWLKELEK